MHQTLRVNIAIAAVVLGVATPAFAWQTPPPQQPPPQTTTPQTPPPQTTPPATPPASGTPPTTPAQSKPPEGTSATDPADGTNRIFGLLPNYTTIEGKEGKVPPITSKESFKMAALDAFDPMVYPLFGVIAGVSQIQNTPESYGRGWEGYAKRYGVAFADNSVCSLVTTGLLPSLLKQDPRYYQGRKNGFFNRLYYAASRSVVTRSRTTGQPQFNLSEIGGTLVVATNSNLYYPAEERNVPDTMQRWGMQAMWDTVGNELKEFWPDIRTKFFTRH